MWSLWIFSGLAKQACCDAGCGGSSVLKIQVNFHDDDLDGDEHDDNQDDNDDNGDNDDDDDDDDIGNNWL